MAAPVFKAVNWSPNEYLGEDKMDALANNTEWLYRNTPRVEYRASNGVRRLEHTKVAAGRVVVAKNLKRDSASVGVNFNGFFNTVCEPVITTGIIANFNTRIHATLRGRGRLVPDATGFIVDVNVAAEQKKNDKIKSTFYIAWNAVGF